MDATDSDIAVEDIAVERVIAGGAGLGRASDGQVVFVDGALPGEQVRARVTERKRGFARAELVAVVEPSPHRVAPPCRHVAEGCGGCDWQHVAPAAQRELKAAIVADALRRIGKLDPPPIGLGPELAPVGYRTTMRLAVDAGRAALRHRRSHDVVAVDGCLVAHPLVRDVVDRGHFGSAREITVRAGVATGERLVRVDRAGVVDDVDVPAGVVVVGPNGRAFIHEEVAGHRFRVSVGSFFQARPDGAAALVDAVAEAAGDVRGRTFVDLYAGVGLFAATVGRAAREVVAVEGSASASADARHNVPDAKVVHGDVNRWKPVAADVVVADPSRAGLGADAVDRIVATGAARVVLVSCDAAALGRDANLLAQRGYELVRATLVDLFPLTSHVEVVTTYVRGAGVGTAARTD